MSAVELEVWSDDRDSDFARIFTGLDDEAAEDLYRHLHDEAEGWIRNQELRPIQLRRRVGRDVRAADVIRWYIEEGLLKKEGQGGKILLRPSPSLCLELERQSTHLTLVPIDG